MMQIEVEHLLAGLPPSNFPADVAMRLAGVGLSVFPCQSDGEKIKSPMPGVFWRNQSTTDRRRIEAWWSRWLEAATGIDLAKSGLFVIDCDCKPGRPDGVAAFADLIAAHGLPDGVPVVETPSGGRHYYFRQPEGAPPHGNGTGSLPAGVDVRGHGGYVIAPGSRIEAGHYAPVDDSPDLCEAMAAGAIPVAPEWLMDRLRGSRKADNDAPAAHAEQAPASAPASGFDDRARAYAVAALDREAAEVANTPESARNNTLNNAAFSLGTLAGNGSLSPSEVVIALTAAARAAGLPAAEAQKTIASGLRAGIKKPRPLPPEKPSVDADTMLNGGKRPGAGHDGGEPLPLEPCKRADVESGGFYISCGDYHMDSKEGLTIEVEKGRGEDKTVETVWIAQPFEVLGACRDPHGAGWGKWLRWRDRDRREHKRHVPEASLQGEPASLCALLADQGMRINRNAQRHLVTYLSRVLPKGRVTMVARTGWHTIAGRDVFVLPGEVIGPRGSENVILDGAALGPYETRGALTDWQGGVGAYSSGHALAVLAISTALAGPLLHLAGAEGGAINFFGPSSKGKSTIAFAGASVWGRGGSPGYVRAWRATANGLEGAAASATDTCLVLDELGLIEAREAAAAIYGLSNGSGKARSARNGDLREPKSWRVLTVSTGEFPLAVKLAEDRGRRARAGQLVRMLDIPAERGLGFGAFDNGGPEGDPGKLSKAIKVASVSAYGTAGPEFVRRLIANGVDGETVRAMVAEFVAAEVRAGADGQIGRAAERLGLIAAAGELATALGVTPWQEGAATGAATWALARWIEGRGGTESAEVRQAIEAVRLAIQQHGESRFESLDGERDARPVNNRLGWRTGSGSDAQWLVPPEVWRSEVCAGLDPKFVAKTLGERGMLERACDGWQAVRRIDGRPTRVFVLLSTIFEGGDHGG